MLIWTRSSLSILPAAVVVYLTSLLDVKLIILCLCINVDGVVQS